jgi:hypothetical protein|tara:strand:+ start:24 stop:344 length:321 start_codon:yes stop_codon:yes gene_type:complete
MEKQEKSYSDWQDEGAHLNKEQWNKARELLTKGESGSEAIRMTENLVLPTNRKMYLSSKPSLYQIGWLNGERGKKDSINVSSKDEVLFDKGYNDCIKNIKNLEEVA